MTSRTSKDTGSITPENPMCLAERMDVRAVSTGAKPMSIVSSVSFETQIEAGKAFMKRYEQTFGALAK